MGEWLKTLQFEDYESRLGGRPYKLPLPQALIRALGNAQHDVILLILKERDIKKHVTVKVLEFSPDDFALHESATGNVEVVRKSGHAVYGLPLLLPPIKLVSDTQGMPPRKRTRLITEQWYSNTKSRWDELISTNNQELLSDDLFFDPIPDRAANRIERARRSENELAEKRVREVGEDALKQIIRLAEADGYTDTDVSNLLSAMKGRHVSRDAARQMICRTQAKARHNTPCEENREMSQDR